jgi:ADP-ribose pyrophosphatase
MQSDLEKLQPWKTLNQSVVFENPWFKIKKQHMRTSSGAELDYYIHDAQDSVICVFVSDDNKLLIEKQYRPAVDKVSIDYPAGRAEKDDKSTEDAVVRELQEETGLTPNSIKKLAVIDKEPGFSTTRMHVFLAKGGMAGKTNQEETESIVNSFVNPSEILEMITSGEMACTFCISATFLAFKELGWLTFDFV